ncbi:uncharacterized protein LOC110842143 [Folsomia candida]|uniref:uncharacterized protein LOC110842143 n=1 Tax=Folsomia candida TaxID=158441 RepID=UPI001605581A|nr:uncharacterized protein LOC110842143 [Folsomia candida]
MLQEVPLDWNFYIAPFSVNLHFMVLFWLWSMSLILWVLQRYPTGQFPYTFMHRRITMKEYVWIAFSCLCQKGAHLLPHIRSSKIVFLVFAFTFLIVYCAYSATLISQLSIAPPVTIPFKGLQDFVTKAKGWTGGPIKGDLMQLYMEKSCPVLLKKGPNAQCELLVQLWTKVVEAEKNRLPTSFIEGLDRVLKEKFAFIASGPGTRNIITKHFPKKDACNIFEMDGDYISSNLAFGFRRNFSHTRSINKQILIIRSSGIYNRLQRIWLPQFEQCAESTTSYTDAGIKNVGVAPLVWLIGGLLSLVILIFEMLNSLTVNRSTLEMNSVYNKKY